ncbi:MAG: MFS transporter [Pseudomonadota bacterium]
MKLFYGWRIVGIAAFFSFLQACLLMHAFGAYVAVLGDEFGWNKTSLSIGAAIQSLEGALLGPLLGWLMDRMGARHMVQAGIVLFGVGFLVLSQIDSLGGFYLAIVIIALGASFSGYFPLTITVMHWFHRRRSRALSIMGLGLAAGGLGVSLVAWSMQAHGWRMTAFASGVIAIVVGWPLARMIRRNPEEVGETVDGVPAPLPVSDAAVSAPGTTAPAAAAARPVVLPNFTAAQALRTPAFWLIAGGHGFALLVVTAVNVHAISHMKSGLGYSVAQASFFITLMTASQILGLLAGAAVGDHWEKRNLAAGCMLAHMTGLLMLAFAFHPAMLVGFALLHGFAWGLRGPIMQSIRADYFGLGSIGMIMGLSGFLIAFGQVAGPMVAGILYDLTGSYRAGFTVLALVAGSGSLLFFFVRPPQTDTRS